MDSEIVLVDRTVVVRNGRIEQVDLRSNVTVPAGAEQIDGSGLFLMPGLADMHVHLREEDLPAYLASDSGPTCFCSNGIPSRTCRPRPIRSASW